MTTKVDLGLVERILRSLTHDDNIKMRMKVEKILDKYIQKEVHDQTTVLRSNLNNERIKMKVNSNIFKSKLQWLNVRLRDTEDKTADMLKELVGLVSKVAQQEVSTKWLETCLKDLERERQGEAEGPESNAEAEAGATGCGWDHEKIHSQMESCIQIMANLGQKLKVASEVNVNHTKRIEDLEALVLSLLTRKDEVHQAEAASPDTAKDSAVQVPGPSHLSTLTLKRDPDSIMTMTGDNKIQDKDQREHDEPEGGHENEMSTGQSVQGLVCPSGRNTNSRFLRSLDFD